MEVKNTKVQNKELTTKAEALEMVAQEKMVQCREVGEKSFRRRCDMLKAAKELKGVKKEKKKEIFNEKGSVERREKEVELSKERLKVLNAHKRKRIRELEHELEKEKAKNAQLMAELSKFKKGGPINTNRENLANYFLYHGTL